MTNYCERVWRTTMSNTPEGAVKDKIKAMLRTYKPHIYYFMPSMGAFGKSGVPDIIACVRGTFEIGRAHV